MTLFKNYPKILTKELIIYSWITIISSWLWQTLLCHYPGDKISAWNFYDVNILFNILFLNGTFEDVFLFHPFGMLFGYFLINFFGVFNKEEKNYTKLKIVFLFVLALILLFFAVFIDYSSRISFLLFSLPGFILIFLNIKRFNILRFLIYVPCMLLFVFIWDFTSVVLLEIIGNKVDPGNGHYWRSWFYILNGEHSLVFSKESWMWIFGKLPVSIDIIYPLSGMIMQIGLITFLRKILYGKQN